MTYNDKQKIKGWISRYSICVNGKWVENGLIGWRTALAHARKYIKNLFDPDNEPKQIEIFNLYTSEIITLEEAENRVKKAQLAKAAPSIHGTITK